MMNYLVCIDSDGCAIDSMEIKHRTCFGPCMIEIWNLQEWKEEILERWNEINLYSKTRGINRFLGLEKILTEVNEKYKTIDGLVEYQTWCHSTKTFSNSEVEKVIHEHEIFNQVLTWSKYVNSSIESISKEIKPFESVKDVLEHIKQVADIAIVSSANPSAVKEEWTRFGFMNHVNYVMAQDAGTKSACISKLIDLGYEKDKILMVGDAMGDYKAATQNQVLYYPIIPQKEEESWKLLQKEAFIKFIEGSYEGNYMNQQIEKFNQALK